MVVLAGEGRFQRSRRSACFSLTMASSSLWNEANRCDDQSRSIHSDVEEGKVKEEAHL